MPQTDVSALPLNPIRALLIDDEADDRTLFAHYFRDSAVGAELEQAEGVDDALRRLDRMARLPDIIFVDLNLVGTPAYEFVHWIRRRDEFAKVLIIAITGDVTWACAGPGEVGADALLIKPISTDDISTLLVLARATRG